MERFAVRLTVEQLEDQLRNLPAPPPFPAPAPAPAPVRRRRSKVLTLSIMDEGNSEEASEAEDEFESRTRKHAHKLADEHLELVRERLLRREPLSREFQFTVPEVLRFFQNEMPEIGKYLRLRTLYDWRESAVAPRIATAPKKLGAPFRLSLAHRNNCGSILKEMGASGSPMNTKIARPVLIGYLIANGLQGLYSPVKAPGKISFSKTWILELFEDFNLSDRAGTTDKQKLPEHWRELVREMNYRVAYLVALHNVPPALVFNLDQFGLKILALSNRTRVETGTKSVPIIGGDDKRQITGVPIVSCANDIVGLQLIWQGKTDKCHPSSGLKGDKMHFTHSENHWSNGATMRHLFEKIIGPHIEAVKEELELSPLQRSIVLLDVWKHHYSAEFKAFMSEKFPHILIVYIPPGCTGEAQVCDLVVNKKMKELATTSTSNEIARCVADQLSQRSRTGDTTAPIKVDIRLSTLKPLVCKGMQQALDFFSTDEGATMISKGFEKAGITQCFSRQFQREASDWASRHGGERALVADFLPAEDAPPSAAGHSQDVIAVVSDPNGDE